MANYKNIVQFSSSGHYPDFFAYVTDEELKILNRAESVYGNLYEAFSHSKIVDDLHNQITEETRNGVRPKFKITSFTVYE